MKKQLSKISVHQTSKAIGLLISFCSLPLYVLGILIVLYGSGPDRFFALLWFVAPIPIYFLTYAIVSLIAQIYNFVAQKYGGIEYEVNDVTN